MLKRSPSFVNFLGWCAALAAIYLATTISALARPDGCDLTQKCWAANPNGIGTEYGSCDMAGYDQVGSWCICIGHPDNWADFGNSDGRCGPPAPIAD